MKFVNLTTATTDKKCGSHSVQVNSDKKILSYYGMPITIMNTVNKTFFQPNKGYSASTTKAQTQYRNCLDMMGYVEQMFEVSGS